MLVLKYFSCLNCCDCFLILFIAAVFLYHKIIPKRTKDRVSQASKLDSNAIQLPLAIVTPQRPNSLWIYIDNNTQFMFVTFTCSMIMMLQRKKQIYFSFILSFLK